MNLDIYRWFILPNIIIQLYCYNSGTLRRFSDIDRHVFGIFESRRTKDCVKTDVICYRHIPCRSVFHWYSRYWRWLGRRLRKFQRFNFAHRWRNLFDTWRPRSISLANALLLVFLENSVSAEGLVADVALVSPCWIWNLNLVIVFI